MARIRITGLVKTADEVRRAIAQPMTPDQRDALRERVRDGLTQVNALLESHRARPGDLPAPSRRAYAYLQQVDLKNVTLVDGAAMPTAARTERAVISFKGLRAYFDRVLDNIAQTIHENRFNATATLQVIRQTAQRLEHHMERDQLMPEQLTVETRDRVAWFRVFAEIESLEAYAAAVARAQKAFAAAPRAGMVWTPPLLVHFRPTRSLYRYRVLADGTRFTLSTPMITFEAKALAQLARLMLGAKRYWPAVTDAMMAEPFQTLSAELELATGETQQTRGAVYDLAEVFERVNTAYFEGQMQRPWLMWSRALTGCKFGHYDFIHGRLCVSSTLDQHSVPPYVIDHVMHHELLHKKHGFRWQGWRQHAHTAEFRAEERTFARFAEASHFLEQLATRIARGR